MERQPPQRPLPVDATNDDVLMFAAQCAADYRALNALHNGLIDWAALVPTEGGEQE